MAAALGAAYTQSGRLDDAVPLLTQAMDQTTASDRVGDEALCRLSLGEAHLLAGRPEEARAVAEDALAQAHAHQERAHEAYALRLLSEIATHREPPDVKQAENYYRQALVLSEALGMRPLQAPCHLGLGTLYAQISRNEQACTQLSTPITLYLAMDMTFWLPRAEGALAQAVGAGGQ